MHEAQEILRPEVIEMFRILESGAIATGVLGFCSGTKGYIKHCSLKRKESSKFVRLDAIPVVKENIPKKINKGGMKNSVKATMNQFVTSFKSRGVDLSNLYRNFRVYGVDSITKELNQINGKDGNNRRDENYFRAKIFDRLLELASSRNYETFSVQGFKRTIYEWDGLDRKVQDTIGIGLNEAYKSTLLYRYLNSYYGVKIKEKSKDMMELVLLLENLVGQSKMEKWFFEGDLAELCNNLTDDPNKAIDWLRKLDHVYAAKNSGNFVTKKLGESSFRSLLIDISKTTIEQAYNEYSYSDRIRWRESLFKMRQLKKVLNSRVCSSARGYRLSGYDLDAIIEYDESWRKKNLQKDIPYDMKMRSLK